MFGCFNSFGSQDELQFKLEAYIVALDDLTTEEIVAVCAAASRGDIGDLKRIPNTAELHQAARPKTRPADKPSPDWRPHQDRFQSANGTLFITEGGHTWTYTAEELTGLGYALPKPPVVLNRAELESRGIKSMHRLQDNRDGAEKLPANVSGLIRGSIKTMEAAE